MNNLTRKIVCDYAKLTGGVYNGVYEHCIPLGVTVVILEAFVDTEHYTVMVIGKHKGVATNTIRTVYETDIV